MQLKRKLFILIKICRCCAANSTSAPSAPAPLHLNQNADENQSLRSSSQSTLPPPPPPPPPDDDDDERWNEPKYQGYNRDYYFSSPHFHDDRQYRTQESAQYQSTQPRRPQEYHPQDAYAHRPMQQYPFAPQPPSPPPSHQEDVQIPSPGLGNDLNKMGAVTPPVTLSQYGPTQPTVIEPAVVEQSHLRNMDKELIFEGLKKMYRKKILPLEESSKYPHFHSPSLNPADFEAKPMVLIVGQYSVGKTSFIRSLVGRDFPGQRVGPEPTTDRFTAIMYGDDEGVMPGHALAMQANQPFRSLQQFGNNFLSKFEGSVVSAPILRNITLIDSPGVLSGEKQRIGRDYDFSAVISWFAERADLIVVMFDAHKLDISDELKMVIDTLQPHHDKVRVLLNKADAIDTQQLMRVYGALMWSLGKVMQTPEVCRVYIGSFWDAPLFNLENRLLLEREKRDLIDELMCLPDNAVLRRINELVKRARSVKVHAYIIHYLRKQMPYLVKKQEKQAELMAHLDQEFIACARRYGLPLGDFPNVGQFRKMLREIKDISRFSKLDKSLVAEMDKVFTHEIPRLMEKAQRTSYSAEPQE